MQSHRNQQLTQAKLDQSLLNYDNAERNYRNKLDQVNRSGTNNTATQQRLNYIDQLTDSVSSLQQQEYQLFQDCSDADSRRASTQEQLNTLNSSLQSLQSDEANTERELARLEKIINSPSPKLRQSKRCIHGHINCQHLPNTVVTEENRAEVDAHQKKVKKARELAFTVRQQLLSIQFSLTSTQQERDYVANDLVNANKDCDEKENELATIREQLEQAQQALVDAQGGGNLGVGAALSSLQQELAYAQANLLSAENQLMDARLEHARAQGDRSVADAVLMQIAARELEEEQAAELAANPPEESRPNSNRFFQAAGRYVYAANAAIEQGVESVIGTAGEVRREIRSAAGAIGNVGQSFRSTVASGVAELSNAYPSPGPALVGLMFDTWNESTQDQSTQKRY